mgnify:CR=1 FL=1
MATNVYTFYPNFKEYLPLYHNVTNVWLGDGKNTKPGFNTSGMIYVMYEDGMVEELGSVSMYAVAKANGYTGTEAQWTQMILEVAALVKGATASIAYMTTDDGQNHPDPESEDWAETPTPEKGKYVWTKIDLRWIDSTTTTIYSVSYQGEDGSVESVNGSVGEVLLYGDNIMIDGDHEQTIKNYIDSLTPETATNAQIDALFGIVTPEEDPEEDPENNPENNPDDNSNENSGDNSEENNSGDEP